MRKLSMKGKRRRSDNDNSDGESEENGGAGSNAGNSVDTTEVEAMPKSKRRASRAKNNGKNGDDESVTANNEDAEEVEMKNDENENGHGEKGGAKKRRKKEEQKAATSTQDETEEDPDDDSKEYEVEKIVAHRMIKGRRQFLVRWKGYDEDSDTWEQEKDLNCQKLIDGFLAEQGNPDEAEPSPKVSKKADKKGKKAKNGKKDISIKEDDNAEYEVEKIIDVYFKKDGKREFLIRWKGFKTSDDTWEPEDHLNCPELIKKFMIKVEEAKAMAPRSLRTDPVHTKRYTLTTNDSGRRLSRRNTGKQRATYHECDE